MSDFSRFFPGALGPSVLSVYFGFPPLTPPRFTLLVVGWSSPMALLLPVSPFSTASACHHRLLLSLFPFLTSFGITVSVYFPLLLFLCRFSLSTCLIAWLLALSFDWVAGCFVARAPLCISTLLRSSWGSRLPHYRLPPYSWILLRFLSFSPLLLYLAISLSFSFSIRAFRCLPSLATVSSVPVHYSFFPDVCGIGRLAWLFHSLHLLSMVYLPLSFLPVRPFSLVL